MTESKVHDVLIVGGGPAGLSAALYAARDRYDTLILEKNGLPGGQIMLTERVENYPGYVKVAGPELIESMRKQAENFGAAVAVNKAASKLLRRDDGVLEVQVNDGEEAFLARVAILCPGSDYRQLGVPGEKEMRQAGKVSYCATCDGAFFRDKHVLCVGGGNTAVEDTIYLASRFAAKTTLVHRRKEFRAQKVLVEELHETAGKKDLQIKLPYVLTEIVGNADKSRIDHVKLRNVETEAVEQLKVDGVFVFVGMVPNTSWLRGALEANDAGYVAADCTTMKTAVPGVFVAGDCRQGAAMQLATACADGVIAAMMAKDYLKDPRNWSKDLKHTDLGSGW